MCSKITHTFYKLSRQGNILTLISIKLSLLYYQLPRSIKNIVIDINRS